MSFTGSYTEVEPYEAPTHETKAGPQKATTFDPYRASSVSDFCSMVYVFVCLKYKYFIWKNVATSRKTDVILHPFLAFNGHLFTTTTLLGPQGAVVGGMTEFRSVSRITMMSLSNR